MELAILEAKYRYPAPRLNLQYGERKRMSNLWSLVKMLMVIGFLLSPPAHSESSDSDGKDTGGNSDVRDFSQKA